MGWEDLFAHQGTKPTSNDTSMSCMDIASKDCMRISLLPCGLLDLHEQAGILLPNDLVDPGQSCLGSTDLLPQGLVLELDHLL